jgi:hypothetical protein
MLRLIFAVILNLFLGATAYALSMKMPSEKIPMLVSIAFMVALSVSGLMLLTKKEEIKKAKKALKEGEVHHLLCCCTALEAGGNGTLALVRSNRTKELKLLIFDKEPPPIFVKEEGEVVPYK